MIFPPNDTPKPLCVDLFCGLGGWTEGFLSEGFEVIGFDIERHIYGDHRYPAQLVLQDVRTLHGSQFRDATIIVSSSPCQEFSYRAMPWKRAKALGLPELGMELFAQAGRIQKEASEAAGRYIPMIQENVRGAQKYVGRAQWHYGSYYLWGDVPALMPITGGRSVMKEGVAHRANGETNFHGSAERASKVPGLSSTVRGGKKGISAVGFNVMACRQLKAEGKKCGGGWFGSGNDMSLMRQHSSKSSARRAASARIAKIPFPLAQHIARTFYPKEMRGAA